MSKFIGYNQDVVTWPTERLSELAVPGTDACFMNVQSSDEVLFKVRGPIELKLAVETFLITDEDTTMVSLQSERRGVISLRATTRHLSQCEKAHVSWYDCNVRDISRVAWIKSKQNSDLNEKLG